jgi:hypothetical protein
MASMKTKVVSRIKQIIAIVRGHPLSPDLALEIFESIEIECSGIVPPSPNGEKQNWMKSKLYGAKDTRNAGDYH